METSNKDRKYYRRYNTRKDCRMHGNKDLMKMLLVSTDPLISKYIPEKNHRKTQTPQEIDFLFVVSDTNEEDNYEDDTNFTYAEPWESTDEESDEGSNHDTDDNVSDEDSD